MEAALVSVATAALKPVMGKLGTLLGDKYKRFKGVHGEIEFLTRELAAMDVFLMKISEEEDPDVQDKVWMNEVRELSYDMEDCIDDFMQSINDKDSKPGFMDKINHLLGKMKARRRIGNEINDLKKQITQVGEKNTRYKTELGKRNARHNPVKAFSETINGAVDTRALVIFDHVSKIVGIDESRTEIINLLTEEEGHVSTRQPKIVSIVGSGGMGKTTLANQVYQKLRREFHSFAFVSVSRSPNMTNILRTILSKISKKNYAVTEEGSIQQLAININEFLKDKRYFIVVDDIWDMDAWDVIKCVFPMTSTGSRIIITTRINSIAEACSSSFNGHIFAIRPLGIVNSRKLFYRRLFDSEEHCPSHLEEVSDQILQKCDGMPLAITAISGLLASKQKTVLIWNEVKDSIGYALERNRSVESMMKILSLSYFDLPSLLKTCILYLGIFPEDAIIKKKRLIRSWIAEGFFHKEGRYTVDELGEMCFNELVNRSLVQLVIDEDHKLNTIRVHDTILDFIISKSTESNFVTLVGVPFVPINGERKARRLSLQVGREESSIVPTRGLVLSHARSLNIFGNSEIPRLDEFTRARSLDFGGPGSPYPGSSKLKSHHINNIGRLLYLRYLNLRGTEITELPAHIGCLRCLQILDLRDTFVRKLPASIVNLGNLVQLFTDREVAFPDGIVKLQSLEVLQQVGFFRQTFKFMQELGQFLNLRMLSIDFQEHIPYGGTRDATEWEEAIASFIHGLISMINLCCLKIRNGTSLPLGTLCPVPLSLHKLVVHDSPFSKVPEWISSLVNLQEINIEVEGIMQNDLCILGSLPALLKLELNEGYLSSWKLTRSTQGRTRMLTVSGEVGFPYLTKFQYGTKSRGMDMKFAAGSMPKLEMLVIFMGMPCMDETETVGFDFGIKNLPKLVTLVCRVNGDPCSFEASMKSVVSTHPNRPTVLVRGIYP